MSVLPSWWGLIPFTAAADREPLLAGAFDDRAKDPPDLRSVEGVNAPWQEPGQRVDGDEPNVAQLVAVVGKPVERLVVADVNPVRIRAGCYEARQRRVFVVVLNRVHDDRGRGAARAAAHVSGPADREQRLSLTHLPGDIGELPERQG